MITLPSKPKRKPPKGGSRKGIPNIITRDIKEMVLTALHHAGGAEYLLMNAYDNPKAFLALVGRVLPMQVEGSGEGGAIVVKIQHF